MTKQMMRIIIMFLCMMIPLTVSAHNNFSSTNFIGEDDVVDSGGGRTGSTSFNVLSAIGQNSQGTISSASFIIHAGFLHPIPPSPTPTVTATASPTFTWTPTHSPTLTPTETPIVSATPSMTMTETSTSTPVATETASPTISETATESATPTISATITPTVTPTVTSTVTQTATISATSTVSPTITITATHTMTATKHPWAGDNVVFYPNPGIVGQTCWFQVAVGNEGSAEVKITIYNTVGEQVANVQATCYVGFNQLAFDTGNLSPGFYFFKTTIGDKEEGIKKLVLIK